MGREEEGANFYSDLAQYGYSLIHPDQVTDPNELLVALAKSKDLRLLEGFPVVLANALEKDAERLNLTATEQRLKNKVIRKRFDELVVLSFSIFKVFGLDKLSMVAYPKGVADEKRQAEIRNSVLKNRPLEIDKVILDVERVKHTFLRYYLHGREEKLAENKSKLREEFRQEFFLSLFFAQSREKGGAPAGLCRRFGPKKGGPDLPGPHALLIFLVGTSGFEPPTPASRTLCSTRLSHVPTDRGYLF